MMVNKILWDRQKNLYTINISYFEKIFYGTLSNSARNITQKIMITWAKKYRDKNINTIFQIYEGLRQTTVHSLLVK